jgi:hypothetical protein
MKWLTHEQAQEFGHSRTEWPRPQVLGLPVDAQRIADDIPIPPIIVPTSDGPPSITWRWLALFEHRLIVIDIAVHKSALDNTAYCQTHFFPTQDARGDWSVLLELQALPATFDILFPTYIESRMVGSQHIVYRPDFRGIEIPIYNGSSLSDALGLVEYLRRDGRNCSCFVSGPHPDAGWKITDDAGSCHGGIGPLNSQLMQACELSLKYPGKELIVLADLRGIGDVYRIVNGRVVAKPPDVKTVASKSLALP